MKNVSTNKLLKNLQSLVKYVSKKIPFRSKHFSVKTFFRNNLWKRIIWKDNYERPVSTLRQKLLCRKYSNNQQKVYLDDFIEANFLAFQAFKLTDIYIMEIFLWITSHVNNVSEYKNILINDHDWFRNNLYCVKMLPWTSKYFHMFLANESAYIVHQMIEVKKILYCLSGKYNNKYTIRHEICDVCWRV